jgi:hypothetical protein
MYSLLMLVMKCLNNFASLNSYALSWLERKIRHNCFTIRTTMTDLIEEQSLYTLCQRHVVETYPLFVL